MRKIMMVDDEADQIHILKILLGVRNNNDYELLDAKSGTECLQMLKNNQIPDVIILDIMMPGMSGWEVFEKIKENPTWNKIPVIFLTARTDETAKRAGGFLGDDYVEKPYDINELIESIDKVIEKKKK
jgi:CheY-like chemotaxis protein